MLEEIHVTSHPKTDKAVRQKALYIRPGNNTNKELNIPETLVIPYSIWYLYIGISYHTKLSG